MAFDINNDGKLDRADLDELRILVREAQAEPALAAQIPPDLLAKLDVNGDGQLDQDDVDALCALLLKGASGDQAAKLNALRNKLK